VGLFKTLYGIDDRYCTMIARVLVDRRRDSKFALPRADIEKAVADVNQVYRTGMDVALLQLDRTFAG
jgi:hypothetical protein